ncbi:MAG: PAS domain S-box protein [Bacteroidetes bacterium]|nr:MAG: PAS domain S-box protein [Bacteroidota bacterium]
MKEKTNREIISKFIISGFFLGIFFPIAAIAIELISKRLALSTENLARIHTETVVLYIFYSAPLVLGFVAYIMGKNFAKKSREINVNAESQVKKAGKIFDFTERLSQGEIDVDYSFDDGTDDQDRIGNSLVRLRDYLKENKREEEIRRKQEQQQNWATEGMAKFGDILRQNNDNINELSYNIISNLVEYMSARQGGVFILNDNDKNDVHFELTACYAYSRKKFLEKRIEWEEGLVGACALEQETILLKDVPEEHVTITSGLGETKPGCIILVPLKVNDQVHGVIELASLRVFHEFETEFLKKVAESIASVISSVKINLQTAKLLKESQEQGRILASQEDEMRRNMEELNYAKEEAAKQGELLANFTNAVNHTLVRAEYSTQGTLIYANTRFLTKLGYSSNKDVEGKHISIFINEKDKKWFFEIWDDLAKGGKHFEGDMKHVTKQGKDFWSMATYTCVKNADGSIEKILFLGIDITEQKKQNLDYEAQLEALNKNNLKIEYNPDGSIIEANSRFLEISEIPREKLNDFSVYNFVEEGTENSFKKIWHNILKGIPHETQFKLVTASGLEKWIEGTYYTVRDMYGDVFKVIYLAGDITTKKVVELENDRQTLLVKQQEEQLRIQQEEIKSQHIEFKEKMQQHIQEIESVKVRNEKTLEGALDAIVTINQEEKIEFFNKAAEELWGLDKNDVLEKDVRLILPAPHNKELSGKIIAFLKSDKNHLKGNRTEVNIVNKSGEEIPVLLTLSEVKIGEEYTYTAFIQNISVELF